MINQTVWRAENYCSLIPCRASHVASRLVACPCRGKQGPTALFFCGQSAVGPLTKVMAQLGKLANARRQTKKKTLGVVQKQTDLWRVTASCGVRDDWVGRATIGDVIEMY